MKRKLMNKLIEWKQSRRKKSLIIVGARQVGKTYLVKQFAKENYAKDKIIEINFELFPNAKEFFEGDLSPQAIINKIQKDIRYKDIDFKNNENKPYLIFLDEIQSCENALISLKGFSMESNLYHVIASGSLLGVALKRDFNGSYPVGYVEHMELKGLDFEEFLWANGISEEYVNNLRNGILDKLLITKDAHERLLDLYRKYIVIGSLPEAINTFIETNNFEEVYKVQKDLKIGYLQDIRKYSNDNNLKIKVEKCFQSIPLHLKEQNKKFMYKRVERNGRERMFEGALDWLYDAGLVIYCNNTKKIQNPIDTYIKDNHFKLFLFDTGILMSMFESYKRYNVLNGSDDLDIGGIYENAVACSIAKYNDNTLMYYNDNLIDVDFICKYEDKLLLIEVKSGNNLKSHSLNKVSEELRDEQIIPIKLSSKLIENKENKIINVPLYVFALLK